MPKYTVEQAIARGLEIQKRNPTYSQQQRGNTMYDNQYDCSSFMGVINGVGEGGWPPATPSMVEEYTKEGFLHLAFDSSKLKKGDVVVWNKIGTSGEGNNGHTGMYIGNGLIMEMTGPGLLVRAMYYTLGGGQSWQDILRNPRSGLYIVRWEEYGRV